MLAVESMAVLSSVRSRVCHPSILTTLALDFSVPARRESGVAGIQPHPRMTTQVVRVPTVVCNLECAFHRKFSRGSIPRDENAAYTSEFETGMREIGTLHGPVGTKKCLNLSRSGSDNSPSRGDVCTSVHILQFRDNASIRSRPTCDTPGSPDDSFEIRNRRRLAGSRVPRRPG
jgi:hypothetical protein